MRIRVIGSLCTATRMGVRSAEPRSSRPVSTATLPTPFAGSQVVSAEEQAEIHRLESAHIEKVQAELGSRGNDHEGVQS